MQDEYGVKLLATGRRNERITERLREITIRGGDVLLLQAGEAALPNFVRSLALLPRAERSVALGSTRQRFGPIAILVVAILLIALNVVPVVGGFFGAAVVIVAVAALPMREAYGAIEPEVLVLIGALIPISEAVQHTGGTELIAAGLAHVLVGVPALLVLGVLMVTAMACSPFLRNAPTVLVLGPIAVLVARGLSLHPDPFLMAVATGAGCDFLTPIGHQRNTLVMGPAGYRFGDYWKLGLPLSIIVVLLGTPLIAWFWPLVGIEVARQSSNAATIGLPTLRRTGTAVAGSHLSQEGSATWFVSGAWRLMSVTGVQKPAISIISDVKHRDGTIIRARRIRT